MTANGRPPTEGPREPATFRTLLAETVSAIPGAWLVINAVLLTAIVDLVLWYRAAITHERGWLLAALALTVVVLATIAYAITTAILATVKRRRTRPQT